MLIFALESNNVQNSIAIDERLFKEISDGSSEAFEKLYFACKEAVYAYAFAMLRNAYDADDAVSEVFLKIRCAAHLYKPCGKPLAWVFTITRNVCLMKFRSNKKEAAEFEVGNIPGLDAISDAEDRIVLEAALRVLSDGEYKVIILHAVTGLKHREIASLLGLPVSTVLSRYNRGLKKLRKELTPLL